MKILKFLLLFLLIVGLAAWNIFLLVRPKDTNAYYNVDTLIQKFPFLARRILIDKPTDVVINFYPLREQLREGVKEYGDSFGFYFEYLPTGTSIGVNEKTDFISASLVKLPVVMTYYYELEQKGITEGTQTATIEKKHIDASFGDLWKKAEGSQLPLEEAAKLTLTDSDNTAFYVLRDYITKKNFDQVYNGLDIEVRTNKDEVILSAKEYASILKALFFSSILNKEHSQKILDLLSRTKFSDKLPSGVPKNIVVSHKIGVYENGNTLLYQDCGIVYVPDRPYLLCMISKSNENQARERMVKLSKTVYDYVSTVNK